ncbi:MAG: NAD(+)/NADH kinase [Pseudomonadota bacterium]
MNIQRILVIQKKSLYQIYVKEHQEPAIKKAIRSRDPVTQRMSHSHRAQTAAQTQVKTFLSKSKIEAVFRWRGQVRSTKGFDLVIALGGDGTVLDASHLIQDGTPLLGINSSPKTSVGFLCAGTVEELPGLLAAFRNGTLRPKPLTRLRVQIDSKEVLGPCLNDVLFSHACPADLCRFEFGIVTSRKKRQTSEPVLCNIGSSGLWVSTAAGSTAAIRSAGGKIMPISSRKIQYLVREPQFYPEHLPLRGEIRTGEMVVLVNRTRRSTIWADGSHRRTAIQYGQKIVLDTHPCPLLLIRPKH